MVTIIGEDPYSFFKMVMNCFKCESFSMPNMLTYSQGHLIETRAGPTTSRAMYQIIK